MILQLPVPKKEMKEKKKSEDKTPMRDEVFQFVACPNMPLLPPHLATLT